MLFNAIVKDTESGGDTSGSINWNAVAHFVPGRTPTQCSHRWAKSADPNIKKGAWSRAEDIALLKAELEVYCLLNIMRFQ